MEKNSQRVIMISGANRGIGNAIREKLQSENYLLSLGLRNPGAFRDSMEKHEIENVHLHEYDARNPESAESWVRSTLEHFGRIDGLVNNAAIATGIGGKTCEEIDIETWDRVMQVNVRGTWLMTKACLTGLRRSGNGKVINVASDTALWGAPRLLHYVSSKGAVIAMTRSLARELGGDGGPAI